MLARPHIRLFGGVSCLLYASYQNLFKSSYFMSRSAFTRSHPALGALIAHEHGLIQAQIAGEPAGLGAWISPWDIAPVLTTAPGLATLPLKLAGIDSLTGSLSASTSLWPLADSALAVVVLQHALDYAMEPEEMLGEAARCMRGHGKLVIVGFRGISAARLSGTRMERNWKTTPPRWTTASSWARACRALGLADVSIERMAVAWPWLAPDSAFSRQLGRALPDFASVYILSARKRGVRARPVLRALEASANRQPALKAAGLTQRGVSND